MHITKPAPKSVKPQVIKTTRPEEEGNVVKVTREGSNEVENGSHSDQKILFAGNVLVNLMKMLQIILQAPISDHNQEEINILKLAS